MDGIEQIDESDVVCYSLIRKDGQPIVRPVLTEEFERLPESAMETLNIGCLTVHDGVLYGNSPQHLLGTQ